MKILIVLGHNRLTGVNLWASDLSSELMKYGHTVHLMISPAGDPNKMQYVDGYTAFLDQVNTFVYGINQTVGFDSYDVIILNYNLHELMVKFADVPTIFVSHGSMEEWYKPEEKHAYHVGVSDRTTEELGCDETVYNGVDTSKFFRGLDINVKPYGALYLSRYPEPPVLRKACEALGIGLYHAKMSSDIPRLINEFDFVIGYGRSAYEGMACGRPVFIYGDNGCDGWITEWNFKELLRGNCSGWYTECKYDLDGLVDQLEKYDFKQGKINRKLVEENISLEIMGRKFDRIIRNVYETGKDTSKV